MHSTVEFRLQAQQITQSGDGIVATGYVMNLKQERFTSKVLLPLFQGIPQYPYNLIYDDWAAYKRFLINWGINESKIPRPSPTFKPTKAIEKIKEVDFLIQVIIGDVLRKVSMGMKRADLSSIQGTEKHAVRIFLSLADEFFPFRNPQFSQDQDRFRVDSFDRLAELITGEHARLLVGACQRLAYFYSVQTAQELRQGKKATSAVHAPAIKKEDEKSTQLILKEEFVGRLHKAITHHPILQNMISQVNLKKESKDEKIAIELDDEGRGIFKVGKTDIDLRSVLLRIFVALKPEAELLLRLLISKIQPDRINLIEIHYDAGLAEFEVAMMLEDGDISEDVHQAIYDCSTSTTFPKVVVVCSSILEEMLGKKVNISFNRRGDVTIEVPEIEEVQSRNLAVALRKKIEETLLKHENPEEKDPEEVQLQQIGEELERQTQHAVSKPPEAEAPVNTEVDTLIDEDLSRAAEEIQAEQERLARHRPSRPMPPSPATNDQPRVPKSDNSDPFADLPIRPIVNEPEPVASKHRNTTTRDSEIVMFDDDSLVARLEELDTSSPRKKNEQLITMDDSVADSQNSQSPPDRDSSYWGGRNRKHPGAFLTPREVTMAILSDIRTKGVSMRSSQQLAIAFLEVLDKVSRDYCGQNLDKLCPGLSQSDNIFDIARQLNELIDRRRYRREPENAIDALLSGAILASSSIKLSG